MKFLSIIIQVFVLAISVHAGERQFIASWESYDEQLSVYEGPGPNYRKKSELKFPSLKDYAGVISKPAWVESEIEAALILYSQKNTTILLVTPRNIMGSMSTLNEEFRDTMKKCAFDKSWIVVLPQNNWTEINLNPYCTMDYGEDQISVDLYWADSSARPYIDVVTNSLRCVPHTLYGWSRKTERYVLKSGKCTGLKARESFAGSDVHYRQLLPGETFLYP